MALYSCFRESHCAPDARGREPSQPDRPSDYLGISLVVVQCLYMAEQEQRLHVIEKKGLRAATDSNCRTVCLKASINGMPIATQQRRTVSIMNADHLESTFRLCVGR